ncbi:rolling circle replication-associated protein [Vibrio harveyi]|uniref:rolling circle replication-associated protein n=1 Tax=Vibrio harveyi TaxID=669 RepID=UPI00406485BA
MNQSDLLYIGGAVMPLDRIKNNDASYNAGFLGSKIYSDQEQALLDSGMVKKIAVYDRVPNRKSKRERDLQERTDFYKSVNYLSEHDREAAAKIAEEYRLVKGRKSPTEKYRTRRDKQIKQLMTLGKSLRPKNVVSNTDANFSHDTLYETNERSQAGILNQNGKRARGEPKGKIPISMQLMHRSWNETYKFQAVTETPSSAAPAANVGERFSEKLTSRSVSKIFESGAYVAACHGGFSTFLTLTFTQAQRLAIFGGMLGEEECRAMGANHPIMYKRNMVTVHPKAGEKKIWHPITDIGGEYWTVPSKDNRLPKIMNRDGVIAGPYCDIKQKPEQEFTMEKTLETTIGREVSRFIDAAKKMYQRGWVADHTTQVDSESGQKYSDLTNEKVAKYVQPSDIGPTNKAADFHYIWVAECPANEHGEPNPHVHVLLRWTVPEHLFSPWAKRLEKIWGHGFAKLERIKKPKAAGSYIIKAVGYAAKGENADQGLIKGNRYNIAKCSRAPAWETLASFEAGNMTAIIKELGYKLEQWKKPIKRQIRKLQAAKAQTIKAKSIAKQQSKPEDYQNRLYQRIIRLEKQAEKLNKTIKERGVHVSSTNRFCITFEGEDAKQKVDDFMFWAAGARGWALQCRDIDLSDVKHNADHFYQHSFARFKDNQAYWKAVLSDPFYPNEMDEAEANYWRSLTADYLDERHIVMLR